MATTENTYTGDGSTVLYSFTFPYIEVTDINVSVDGVDQDLTTEYTLANATTIEFVTAPAVGTAIRIYRTTGLDDVSSVFYPGSAIRARDLNDNFTQTLYVVQENTANAGAAESAANAAAASAASAAQSSSDAVAAANTATTQANQAITDAAAASALATTADTNASSAVATANAADTKADSALNAVSQVVPFTSVAAVANIPTSPGDGDVVRIIDSTGIESFTPLAGLPVGFVGDPGIYVQIAYSTTGTTWNYQSYAPNDPDARYLATGDNISELTNDAGYALSSSIPTNVSQLTNDANYATVASVPTNVSQLTNDAAYVTAVTAPVTSVNTATGAVVLDTDDVAEGTTNKYSQWTESAGELTYTGDIHVGGAYTGTVNAVGASNVIDCGAGNYFTETVAGAVTFSFSNIPATKSYGLTLEVDFQSGSIAWPASVYWPGGTAPSLTAGKTQLIVLVTSDSGTTWRGNALADFDA